MKTHPTSIRITKEQRAFLRKLATVQKHRKIATVIKRLIEREMGVAS